MWDNLILKHFHKYNLKKNSKRNKYLNEGLYGLKVLESGFITKNELKIIIFYLKKKLKKNGKIWINLNPNYVETKKPIETRMGKGKGNINSYFSVVQKGYIILEIKTNSNQLSFQLLKQVKEKLSLKIKIVKFEL